MINNKEGFLSIGGFRKVGNEYYTRSYKSHTDEIGDKGMELIETIVNKIESSTDTNVEQLQTEFHENLNEFKSKYNQVQ